MQKSVGRVMELLAIQAEQRGRASQTSRFGLEPSGRQSKVVPANRRAAIPMTLQSGVD